MAASLQETRSERSRSHRYDREREGEDKARKRDRSRSRERSGEREERRRHRRSRTEEGEPERWQPEAEPAQLLTDVGAAADAKPVQEAAGAEPAAQEPGSSPLAVPADADVRLACGIGCGGASGLCCGPALACHWCGAVVRRRLDALFSSVWVMLCSTFSRISAVPENLFVPGFSLYNGYFVTHPVHLHVTIHCASGRCVIKSLSP